MSDMEYYLEYTRNRVAVRLTAPIVLRNQAGDVVGRLEAGCVLHSPSLDDVGDVDVGDNSRRKIVFDCPRDAKWEHIDSFEIMKGDMQTTE